MKKFLTIIFGVLFSIPAWTATLPSGYTELAYIESTGTQYIDTGYIPTTDLSKIEFKFNVSTDNATIFGVSNSSTSRVQMWHYQDRYSSRTFTMTTNNISSVVLSLNIDITGNLDVTNGKLIINGNSGISTDIDYKTNYSYPMYIFAMNNIGSASTTIASGKVYYFKVYENNTLVADFVPAKNSSGVIGMYDLADPNPATAFHTNAVAGEFTAGPVVVTNSGPISSVTVSGLVAQNGTPTPTTPIDIVSNNGVLKVSKNLFDKNSSDIKNGYYVVSDQVVGEPLRDFRTSDNNSTSGLIRVFPNTTYTIVGAGGSNPSFIYLDANQNFVDGFRNGNVGTRTFTVPNNNNIYYLRVPFSRPNINIAQLELGSTATTYHPYGEVYVEGTQETIADSANHTATVATLLGVGDYRDTQNINTGAITRNVEVKVLDGTENWVKTTSYANAFRVDNFINSASSLANLSTHFTPSSASTVGDAGTVTTSSNNGRLILGVSTSLATTAEQFKQYLADQYAAGTPVMIVYPLATSTTESVAGQTMTMAPVSNATGGVNGMTITTLLSSGASIVTTIATNAIKIATRTYNTTQFAPVVSALNTAIDTIKDVVTNTINQTAAVSALQSTKQQRPADACPDYKQCLLVETEDGTPQWFVITDPFRDLFSPVIANNIAATGTSNLIDGYTQVEYIESTGTQYIDTGVKLNQNSRVEIGWNYYTSSDISTSGRIFGARYTGVSDKKAFVIGTNTGKSESNTTMFFQYGSTSKNGPNVSIGTWLDIVFDKNVHTINGTQYGESFADTTFETPYTIKIFAFGQSGGSGETETVGAGVGRCSYFKIYNNGTLVRDMVPVLNNVTGKYGMYDKVNNVFYGDESGLATDFSHGNAVANDADVPAATSWSITFSANDTYGYGRSIVYGTAKCNATSGSANDVATAVQIAAANWTATGSNCWCYAERVNETSSGSTGTSANRWVYLAVPSGETCAANCVENCADAMASGAAADKPFRQALVGL